jgi:hypothetical protein
VNRSHRYAVVAVALSLLAGGALAGTTGTEFQALYTWVNDVVTGYFGRAVAVAGRRSWRDPFDCPRQSGSNPVGRWLCDIPAIHADDHHRHPDGNGLSLGILRG